MKIYLFLGITILLPMFQGCTIMYLVFSDWETTYSVAGSYKDYDVFFMGEIKAKPLKGTSKISIQGVNIDVQGSGSSWITYIPPTGSCEGQKGEFLLTFNDGRVVKGTFIALSCSSGWGTGADQEGNIFSFKFGMNQKELQEEIERLATEAKGKPELTPLVSPEEPKQKQKVEGFTSKTI